MSSARFVARRSWMATKFARRSWRPLKGHNPQLNLQSRNAFFLQFQHEHHGDTSTNFDALLSHGALNDFKIDALPSKPCDVDVSSAHVASILARMKDLGNRRSDCVDRQGSAELSRSFRETQRATIGDHVLIKDTQRTRKRFAEGIGKVFVITKDDQAFLPYQCEGSSSWLREDDIKLWQVAPLLTGSSVASEVGRPTVGDHVVIKDTPRTRKQCSEGIGQVCVIRTDDQAFLPYQFEGSSVWLREEDVKLHEATD